MLRASSWWRDPRAREARSLHARASLRAGAWRDPTGSGARSRRGRASVPSRAARDPAREAALPPRVACGLPLGGSRVSTTGIAGFELGDRAFRRGGSPASTRGIAAFEQGERASNARGTRPQSAGIARVDRGDRALGAGFGGAESILLAARATTGAFAAPRGAACVRVLAFAARVDAQNHPPRASSREDRCWRKHFVASEAQAYAVLHGRSLARRWGAPRVAGARPAPAGATLALSAARLKLGPNCAARHGTSLAKRRAHAARSPHAAHGPRTLLRRPPRVRARAHAVRARASASGALRFRAPRGAP